MTDSELLDKLQQACGTHYDGTNAEEIVATLEAKTEQWRAVEETEGT